MATLGWVLICGFILRLILSPLFGGFGYDMDVLRNWARTLADQPLRHFYETAMAPDHLPGDLWLLKLLIDVFHLFGGENLEGTPFLVSLKLVPSIADMLVSLAIYIIVSRYQPESLALRATAFYVFNPATVFLTSVWGQWDSVSLALVLFAFVLMMRDDWLWIAATPLLAWAVVIKPPLGIVAILLVLLPIARLSRGDGKLGNRLRSGAIQVGMAAILGLGTILTIILPFDVGPPGMSARWSLTDRMSVALDLYPFTTLGAFNVWMIPIGSLERVSDLDSGWLSLSAHRWGTLLFVACVAYIVFQVAVRARIQPFHDVVIWGAFAASLAIFMVPTRVHERYLFPAIAFTILLAALRGFPRGPVIVASALSLTFFLNLVMVYGGFRGALPGSIADPVISFLFRAISIVNAVIFAIVMMPPGFSNSRMHRRGSGTRLTGMQSANKMTT